MPGKRRRRDSITFRVTLDGPDAKRWRALTWAFEMTDEQLLAACLETVFALRLARVGPGR